MALQRLFGKPLSLEEMTKKWRSSLRTQERQLDKQIRQIDLQEQKVKQSLKEAAKKNDRVVCTMLAKEVIHARKAKERIHTSKAQLNSVSMQLQQQAAQIKIAGTLKKSTDIMKLVNRLVKLPDIAKDMQEMSMEMMKAGIIEEMMDDAFEVDDEDEIEEEAEEEVNRVLEEITSGIFAKAGQVGTKLPSKQVLDEPEEAIEDDAVQARLSALKS